jgi:D-tyrosyl-tRNA(Tyr) deacylase
MRALIQRVSEASVTVEGAVTGEIKQGLLVLLGIEDADSKEDLQWLAKKVVGLRIFSDSEGLMNLSVADVGGQILLVSQFTLHAKTKKGTRPSFIQAARPEKAEPIYGQFAVELEKLLGKPTQKGVFGAHMDVALINDGPVTIWIDSKNKE